MFPVLGGREAADARGATRTVAIVSKFGTHGGRGRGERWQALGRRLKPKTEFCVTAERSTNRNSEREMRSTERKALGPAKSVPASRVRHAQRKRRHTK